MRQVDAELFKIMPKLQILPDKEKKFNNYILLDILVYSIAVYFYESRSIFRYFGEPEGRVKNTNDE